jgi:hypothetical protein
MPELTSRPQELVVTATIRPAQDFVHTIEWASETLNRTIPGASTTITPDGVMVAQVPANTDLQMVHAMLGGNFSVAINERLQY